MRVKGAELLNQGAVRRKDSHLLHVHEEKDEARERQAARRTVLIDQHAQQEELERQLHVHVVPNVQAIAIAIVVVVAASCLVFVARSAASLVVVVVVVVSRVVGAGRAGRRFPANGARPMAGERGDSSRHRHSWHAALAVVVVVVVGVRRQRLHLVERHVESRHHASVVHLVRRHVLLLLRLLRHALVTSTAGPHRRRRIHRTVKGGRGRVEPVWTDRWVRAVGAGRVHVGWEGAAAARGRHLLTCARSLGGTSRRLTIANNRPKRCLICRGQGRASHALLLLLLLLRQWRRRRSVSGGIVGSGGGGRRHGLWLRRRCRWCRGRQRLCLRLRLRLWLQRWVGTRSVGNFTCGVRPSPLALRFFLGRPPPGRRHL
mmetsp:Transcript_41526/g.88387  ORF Transcript_41526/g.88387 Transcript_41526/m.88387 type:complete len:374 (+) Transcript_41526:1779-2900(+)